MSKQIRELLILFLIAFIYGLSVLAFRNLYENNSQKKQSDWNTTVLDGDANNFYDRAVSLSSFKTYDQDCLPAVAYYRPPEYPFFMAFIFLMFGISLKAIIIFQILITSIIVILIANSCKILFDKKTGMVAGILTILYYPLWNASVTINSELLSMF